MKATDLTINLPDSYFGLLKNLNSDTKLELIALLSKSMKSSKKSKDNSLKALFGALINEKSAEEIIKEIRDDRNFKSKRVDM